MKANKLRVIQDFEKVSKDIQEQIKLVYPNGFSQHLIEYKDKEDKTVYPALRNVGGDDGCLYQS